MKKLFQIIGVIVVVIVALSLLASVFSDDKKTADSKGTAAKTDNATLNSGDAADAGAWSYQSDTDKMTSTVVYQASVSAEKELELKPPYDGGSAVSLHIRENSGKYDIFVRITKGQLIAASPGGGNSIRVRFDNDPAESYSVSGPADFSSEVVFINSTKKFLDKLKKSQKLLIETELFDNGSQQMEFNTKGLKWDRPSGANS